MKKQTEPKPEVEPLNALDLEAYGNLSDDWRQSVLDEIESVENDTPPLPKAKPVFSWARWYGMA